MKTRLFPTYDEFKENSSDFNWYEHIDSMLELRKPKLKKINYFNYLVYCIKYSFNYLVYCIKYSGIICKIFGHKIKMEISGNAESGPVTDWWCERCGVGGTKW
jgi:hypothetical protein